MRLLLSTLLFFILTFATSQTKFSHAAGIAGYIGTRDATSKDIAVTYSPRYNFLKVGENSNLSIGTHLGLGYVISDRAVSSLAYHIPILLEFNFGHASDRTKYANKSGGFIGVGYSIDNSQRTLKFNNGFLTSYTTIEDVISGPMANMGLRFKFFGKSAGIRISYLYGTGDFKGGYLTSIGFQYNIGVK
ncbi:hypothetical protein [Hanstruepera ponticola]|uniref:hypothetical protein n=1 Tax=Hanstruepera ponticola TaxID=2042995 RepID=UPI0017818C15|nr:hypothetical protein [Hanstruepera ponticola]